MTQAIEYVDTHAHIHFSDYKLDADEVWQSAQKQGITRMIAVGCRLEDSKRAVDFANTHKGVWAAVGIHPHEAKDFLGHKTSKSDLELLVQDSNAKKIVAIGECGLDYYYNHSSKERQIELLEFQLELAQKYDLPVIFHVRDAFSDFWPIFDRFKIKSGVIHSFTGVEDDVKEALKRGLYVGLNGIMTFTKQLEQLEAAKIIPLDRLVIETDAPYLTPKPLRGKICKPEHVKHTAAFLAEIRGESMEEFAGQTTQNALRLFKID